MFTATKIESTIKPEKFESLNNGVWYYNYDITEKTVKTTDMEGEEKDEIRYNYVQVRVQGIPTAQKCIDAILKAFVDENGTTLYHSVTVDQEITNQVEDIIYDIKVDFGQEEALTALEAAKKEVLRKIEEYDVSDSVNSFTLNGVQVWLTKDTRVGLMNSLSIEKDSGKETSTLWFNNICLTINCDAAIQMLSSLELYALECYNKTAQHKVAVGALTSVSEVKNYDYTSGYPEKLSFTI